MLADHPVLPILLSTDMAVSRSFYEGTLGLELVTENVALMAEFLDLRAPKALASFPECRAPWRSCTW